MLPVCLAVECAATEPMPVILHVPLILDKNPCTLYMLYAVIGLRCVMNYLSKNPCDSGCCHSSPYSFAPLRMCNQPQDIMAMQVARGERTRDGE